MRFGDIVDHRFEIQELAGAGGMGQIYRARDRHTGELVALKVLNSASSTDLVRFAREAEALASLRLPGVVRYVAQGVSAGDRPYIAMEWLAGETLSARIERAELTLAETMTLAARTAVTLAAIHRLGFVHRDLKPSNLLLVGGAVDEVRLIDFGIVRISGHDQALTRTGAVLGTPGYMAPEQARGLKQLDARADVFSFGCILYRCLTGQPAFLGTGVELLANVLLSEPPRIRLVRPGIPARLDGLVARMLSKTPGDRPRDGTAVAAELASIGLHFDAAAPGAVDAPLSERAASALSRKELRFVCLVLAQLRAAADDATFVDSEIEQQREELAALAARYRGTFEMLDGITPMITLFEPSVASDPAEKAVLCAAALQAALGGAPVAVVTGRSERGGHFPAAVLIDKAIQLLTERPVSEGLVRVDEVTTRLLAARFPVIREHDGGWIKPSQGQPDTIGELLGRPTSCVGRERELSLLAAELDWCIGEPAASAAVVLGAAGLGKSRLRQEFVRRVQERGAPVEVWLGWADAMSAGAAFGLLARALAGVFDLRDDDPWQVRCQKVLSRVQRHGSSGLDVPHVAAFLGELVGAPFPDEQSGKLRAARRSSMLMGDQIRAAWEDFVCAECRLRPIVLVFEDLHWGDLPSVSLVGAALRQAKDLPLFVLLLGRPEVAELFPDLFGDFPVQRVRLTPLLRRASEQLVREVLGGGADPELVARLVARADGSPLFLEELIRAVSGGKADDLLETVVAMVQARLQALGDGERLALRAASIFGETFWHDGVAAILGREDVGPWLDALMARELIAPRRELRCGEDLAFRFRHALLRDAAYAMLTERDVRRGHTLAGEWLERNGRADPLALAEHFERGGAGDRAAAAYLRAAEQSLRGNDLAGAAARAARGLACHPGPDQRTLGACLRVQAEVHLWRGEFSLAEQRAALALERIERGSSPWFSTATLLVLALNKQGSLDRLEARVLELSTTSAEPGAAIARDSFLAECATALLLGGRHAIADALLEAIGRSSGEAAAREPEVIARLEQARALRITPAGDPEACLAAFAACLAALERAGDRRNACMARMNVGACHSELGDFVAARDVLRAALADAERMALQEVVGHCLHNLGLVLAYSGDVAQGAATETAALRAAEQMGDQRLAAGARCYLAQIALLGGDVEAAEREARWALEVPDAASPVRVLALAVRARALVELGRPEEALAAATEALAGLRSRGTLDEGESIVRLSHGEALAAAGREREAAAALLEARDALLARADKLHDAARRERFLKAIPHHARTLERAQALEPRAARGP